MVCGNEDGDAQRPHNSAQEGCSDMNGCTGSGCQQQAQHQPQGSFGSWARRQQTAVCSQPTDDASVCGTCRKCKQRPAVLQIRQQEPYCYECLEAGVQQKVRTATKTQGLIQTADNVLIAVSGGAASLALLSCIVEMKSINTSRPERGKVPFQLTVVHIDDSAAVGTSSDQAADQLQQLRSAVAAAGYQEDLLVLPLAAVFADEQQLQQQLQPPAVQQLQQQMNDLHVSAAQQQHTVCQGIHESTPAACEIPTPHPSYHGQLCHLLSSVNDTTGAEDLITHLQEQLLVRVAAALSCNRLLLGECASRVASKIIADAAKGRGYSLSADIQLLDARSVPKGGPAVVHPLRDVTYRELVALCTYKGIPWSDRAPGMPLIEHKKQETAGRGSKGSGRARSGAQSINALAERFIDDMQSSVPGSIYAILRTAAHLQPFQFNNISAVPEAANAVLPPTARAERAKHLQQQQQLQTSVTSCDTAAHVGSSFQYQLCSLCRAPLPAADNVRSVEGSPCTTTTYAAASAAAAAEARLVLAGLSGDHSRMLCYCCNRQILSKLQDSTSNSNEADSCLEVKMQRLKQLLPPGMLLDDD